MSPGREEAGRRRAKRHRGAGVPAWIHDIESRSSMRWVNPRVIPARGVSAGTDPPYGVGLRDGLYGQAGVALAFEMGEVPQTCVQSQGSSPRDRECPLHELQPGDDLRASDGSTEITLASRANVAQDRLIPSRAGARIGSTIGAKFARRSLGTPFWNGSLTRRKARHIGGPTGVGHELLP